MSPAVLDQVLQCLPRTGVSLVFGYGSKVIKQAGAVSRNDLVDVIVAVDDPYRWHEENLERNNHHYSLVRLLPTAAKKVTWLQEEFGAKVYFNPYVNINNLAMKYGVIKTDHLIQDLTYWDELYIAGRLHKPVEFLINTCDKNETLRKALRFNKESALRAALLQLPENFDRIRLYETITGLSYHGDVRMAFAEDKNKVRNIAEAQCERFDQLYLPILKMSPGFKDVVHWSESGRRFNQDQSINTLLRHLKLLPRGLKRSICQIHQSEVKVNESEIVLASLARNINCDRIVVDAIGTIVRKSSRSQALKGLITAGFFKSLRYSQRKLIKSLASRFSFL